MPPRKNTESGAFRSLSAGDMPLAPYSLVFLAFYVSFALPNLVFSGEYFFSTLHLMKWAATLAPLALLGALAGYRVLRYGTNATGFRLDGFAVLWLALLLYVTAQPLWTTIRSKETIVQEWFFFGALWLAYVLATLLADKRLLRALLWGALINAALSVLFAEMQIHHAVEGFSFILPTPGHYIANTGQANMFALWMAIAGLGGAFLFLSEERTRLARAAAICLLIPVFWGLIASTSRSGILSFILGFATLAAFLLRLEGRRRLPAIALVIALFIAAGWANITLYPERAARLTHKMGDVIERPLTIANRDTIWATAWTMFTEQPVKGVGLGQFKWNYLHAQRTMLERWPHMKWQYTHWAHNEFLQWMAETGAAGAAVFFFLWLWWAWSALRAFVHKEALSGGAVWGSALVMLFGFDALWTRPFHRIENAVWLALAFALTNREILRPLFPVPSPKQFEKGGRLVGAMVCFTCLAGLLYLGDGVRGDRLLRLAAESRGAPALQKEYMERARRSPMIRETAEKHMGYFTVLLGEHTKDSQLIADGLNALVNFFEKQPHVAELNFLTKWARRLDHEGLKEYVSQFTSGPMVKDSVIEPVSAP